VVDKRLEIATDAGVATLKRQGDTLNSLRNRASAVLSVAALVISVGGGIGLIRTGASHGAVLPRWAGFSLMAVVILIGILVVTVQWPVRRWAYGLGPGPVFELSKGKDEVGLLRDLILLMAEAVEKNERVLGKRIRYYQIATVLLVVEVIIFVLAITSS
jgi:hypothetical protein